MDFNIFNTWQENKKYIPHTIWSQLTPVTKDLLTKLYGSYEEWQKGNHPLEEYIYLFDIQLGDFIRQNRLLMKLGFEPVEEEPDVVLYNYFLNKINS